MRLIETPEDGGRPDLTRLQKMRTPKHSAREGGGRAGGGDVDVDPNLGDYPSNGNAAGAGGGLRYPRAGPRRTTAVKAAARRKHRAQKKDHAATRIQARVRGRQAVQRRLSMQALREDARRASVELRRREEAKRREMYVEGGGGEDGNNREREERWMSRTTRGWGLYTEVCGFLVLCKML